jgi:hypothetical protein
MHNGFAKSLSYKTFKHRYYAQVGIGYYAASLICEFGFLDGLPIVSGMKVNYHMIIQRRIDDYRHVQMQ